MRATVGDPRRYPGSFGNLLLNSHLQVWKCPAHLLNTRELSRQVAIAIERRSRREIALACDNVPVLGDLGKVGVRLEFTAAWRCLTFRCSPIAA